MSFSEIFPSPPAPPEFGELESVVQQFFHVQEMRPQPNGVAFFGQLIYDADFTFEQLRSHLQPLGYTPLLGREGEVDFLFAQEGLIPPPAPGRPWVNGLLLLATIMTTIMAGGAQVGVDWLAVIESGSGEAWTTAVIAGLPFSATLLLILGVHELGHYYAARYHQVAVSLPYFIPLPGLGLGTLGAFISLKSPMKNRQQLFDIGIAGPIAGFVVALPLFFLGIILSELVPVAHVPEGVGFTLGRSFLVEVIHWLMGLPVDGFVLFVSPVYFAAWIGFYITALNLLPAGQLDGGHIAYALFGRQAHQIARLIFLLLLGAGFLFSTTWLFWAFFIYMTGLRHPPPLNDLSKLDEGRRNLGYLAIVLFLMLFIPQPFS